MNHLQAAEAAHVAGDRVGAIAALNQHLNAEPDDALALYRVGAQMIEDGNPGLAFSLFDKVRVLSPDEPLGWNGMGRALDYMGRHEEALQCFMAAQERGPNDYHVLNNLALMLMKLGHKEEARGLFDRVLELNPQPFSATENLGLLLLSMGEWEEAWVCADVGMGRNADRKERRYADEPRWNGWPVDGDLAVFGEQGVGDEVFYAACLPDLLKAQRRVVLDCHPKLAGLFRRSFPDITVYGTRYEPKVRWPAKRDIKAHVGIGELPRFYRPSPESCPGTPYLVADPERRKAMRGLLDALPGKKIGLAWTGGRVETNGPERQIGLQELINGLGAGPFGDVEDVTFVSLQYKAAPEADWFGVRHWPWIVESKNYDDTAALVAELDAVISVPTSVVNLCGALGTKCWVLLPENYQHWRYGCPGSKHWWYRSLKVVRQQDGRWPLAEVMQEAMDGALDV
jgi:hypothetical protein